MIESEVEMAIVSLEGYMHSLESGFHEEAHSLMGQHLKMDEHQWAVRVQLEPSHLYLEKRQQILIVSLQQTGV